LQIVQGEINYDGLYLSDKHQKLLAVLGCEFAQIFQYGFAISLLKISTMKSKFDQGDRAMSFMESIKESRKGIEQCESIHNSFDSSKSTLHE
jgi:hypothetical protein